MSGRAEHQEYSPLMFTSDMDQSIEFAMAFLVGLFGLILLLAWLEKPHDVRRVSLWARSLVRRQDREKELP